MDLLYALVLILLVLWLAGFALSIGGGLIHLLLLAAVVVVLFRILSGRRAL